MVVGKNAAGIRIEIAASHSCWTLSGGQRLHLIHTDLDFITVLKVNYTDQHAAQTYIHPVYKRKLRLNYWTNVNPVRLIRKLFKFSLI